MIIGFIIIRLDHIMSKIHLLIFYSHYVKKQIFWQTGWQITKHLPIVILPEKCHNGKRSKFYG